MVGMVGIFPNAFEKTVTGQTARIASNTAWLRKKKRRQRKEVEEKIRHWDKFEHRYFVEAIGNAVLDERDPQPFVEAYRKREAEIEALSLEIEKLTKP